MSDGEIPNPLVNYSYHCSRTRLFNGVIDHFIEWVHYCSKRTTMVLAAIGASFVLLVLMVRLRIVSHYLALRMTPFFYCLKNISTYKERYCEFEGSSLVDLIAYLTTVHFWILRFSLNSEIGFGLKRNRGNHTIHMYHLQTLIAVSSMEIYVQVPLFF